jgi:hypothetical protein
VNLRNWLKKTPRPAVVMADAQRIEVPNNARAINDLIGTITALEPAKLTCLDAKGAVIRSIVLDDVESSAAAEARAAASPEMSDLQLFATLLAQGYEHGRKANQPIVEQAMGFVERQGQRLAAAEREIERLRQHNNRLHQQIAELRVIPVTAPQSGGGDDSIMGALLAGAVQSQLAGLTDAARGAASGGGAAAPVTPIKSGGNKPK